VAARTPSALAAAHAPSHVLYIQIEPSPIPIATIFSSFAVLQHMLAAIPFHCIN
jgi:hypothetical protein